MRVCKKCGETKELTEFYPQTSHCKVCKNAYTVAHRRLHVEQANETRRKWTARNKEVMALRRKSPEGKARDLLTHMRGFNTRAGIPPPDFELSEVVAYVRGVCSKTGIPFKLSHSGDSTKNPFAPSPDRINPKQGYTKENVQWVCWMYNAMKSDFSLEDVDKFVTALKGGV